ncbi:MAG TPA: PilZ domain-containing protein [Stellaceae bacterium]|jgi:hypothetical protein|nr:PilZ domain-containing protein [Stellaceae bacterium]
MSAAMPIAFNKLDRAEMRCQRRYMTPVFEIIVECELFRSLDVSMGGAHLDGVCEGMPVGTPVEGWIALPGMARAFSFSGEILRTDGNTGNTVVRFDDIEPETAQFFDNAVAWRLH